MVSLKEQSWLGWGWELPSGERAVLEPNWYHRHCFSEASKALQGCSHLGLSQLVFVSCRPKLFWDNVSQRLNLHSAP